MTVEEARKRRQEAELKVVEALVEYERATGLPVEGVYVNRHGVCITVNIRSWV